MRIKPSQLTAIISCTLAALFSGATIATAQAPSKVVAHYRFEDGPGAVGTIFDSGPNLLHGTSAGTLSYSTDRASPPATGNFSLDALGDMNFAQIPNNALLRQQGDFTVEMFIKVDAPYDDYGSPGFSTFAVKLNTAEGGSFLGGFEFDYGLSGNVGGSISFGGGAGVGFGGPALVNDGEWHHIALVMDRDVSGSTDQLRFYVDGVLDSITQGVWPNLFYGDQPLYIGAGNFLGPGSSFRRNFDGLIDEFRLTSAALTPAEFLAPATVPHHTSTWNSTTGNWSDPTKWSTPTAPGTFPNNGASTYDAVQSGGSLTVDLPVAIQKFTMSGRSVLTATSSITFNEVLSVATPSSDTESEIRVMSLNGSGVIQANGGLSWSAGWPGIPFGFGVSEFTGVNTAVIDGRTLATDVINLSGTTTIHGGGVKRLVRRALNHGDGVNPSTANWTAGQLAFSNNAVFTNKAGAAFNNTHDGLMANSAGTNFFINEGAFTKSAGIGTTSVNIVFDNKSSGTVNVNSGRLSLNGGGLHSGGFVVATGRELAFGGGTHVLNAGATFAGAGSVSLGNATLTANVNTAFSTPLSLVAPAPGISSAVVTQILSGPGTILVSGPMTWNAVYSSSTNATGISDVVGFNTAVIDGRTQATDAINITGGLTLNGEGIKSVNKRALNHGDGVNASLASWTAGILAISDAGVFRNKAGATFDTNFNGLVQHRGGAASTFINEGTFTKSGGDGNTDIGVSFDNSGILNVNSGTIRLLGISAHTGNIVVAPGKTLRFASGSHALNTGATFSGAGSISIDSGFVTANANVTIVNPLTLKAPQSVSGANTTMTLNGPATINVTAPMVWSAQTDGASQIGVSKIQGVNTAVVNGRTLATDAINITGGLALNGAGIKYLDRRALNHGDGVNPSVASWTEANVVIANNAVFTNKAGATFTTNFNGTFSHDPNDTTVPPGTFINEGVFTKNGGSGTTLLNTNLAFINSGTVNASSGNIAFNGGYTQTAGALVLNGGSVSRSTGTFTINDGKIQGAGTISGAVSASGGTVHIEPGIGTATGTLFITGDLTLSTGSKLSIDIGGTTAGTQHDKITEGGGSVTSVAGVTLEASLSGPYFPAPADTFIVFDAATTAITGSFANAANGSRIASTDGKGTFKVNYGSGTAIAGNADKVILSDFRTTPTSLTLDDNKIVENAPSGTVVGLLSATDPNAAATFTFSFIDIVNFPDNNQFQIGGVSGNELQAKAGLDFETKTSYRIRLRVTNNSGGFLDQTVEQSFTIQVQDVPNPSILDLSADSISENLPVNTVIGALSATDPTPGSTFTFALVSGTGDADNGKFNLSGTSLRSSQILDFETAPGPFSIRVRVTNNGGESLEQVLSITHINEGVTDFLVSNSTVKENLPVGTALGTLSATVTPVGTLVSTYTLVTGEGSTDNALFTVDGSTLKIAALLDYEVAATRSVRLKATDENGETFEKAVIITVTDVTTPTTLALSANSIAENQPINTLIGTLSATDPASEATFSFTLVSGSGDTDNARFNLSGTSLRSSEVFDFETTPGPFSIRVRVTNDGGEALDQTFSITLQDQGPTTLALSQTSFPEGRPVGTTVGTLSVPGTEGGASFNYSLIESATFPDNGFFSIQSNELRTSEVFDFDHPLFTRKTFNIRVRVTDTADEPRDETFVITLTDIGPTDIVLTPSSIAENLPSNTVIGHLSALVEPADPMASPTFSFLGRAPLAFADSRTLVTAQPLSSVLTPTITVRIRAEYLGESFEKDITIKVTANPAVLRVDHPFDTSLGAGAGTLSLGDASVGQVTGGMVILRNAGPAHIFNLRIVNPAPPANEANATSNYLNILRNLGPGETIGVNIDFSPAALGQRSSVVTFRSDNAPDYPLTVTARGIGAEISVQHPLDTELVNGASLDFGDQPIGVSFPARNFIVENVGTLTSLDSIAATITGPDADFFVLDTQGLAASLAAGSTTSFRVKFQPDALRRYNATLSIASTDADENPFDIPLTGEGVTPLMIAQMAYAKASDAGAFDQVSGITGGAVAVSGSTVVVGARGEDGPSGTLSNSGSVYVFVRDSLTGVWSEQAKLRASNAAADDGFGQAVAISGNTIVVGADGEDGIASSSGAVYVFERSGVKWTQQAHLKASNAGSNDRFGGSVAIAGGTIVVGASMESSNAMGVNGDGTDNSAVSSGAAYVFQRSGTSWIQEAYLKASNTGGNDTFGTAVSIHEDTIVVGAPREDGDSPGVNGDQTNNAAQNSGAAYVFHRVSHPTGGIWSQQAYLKASNPGGSSNFYFSGDSFGAAVSVSGDTVVVGANQEDGGAVGINGNQASNSGVGRGAAYIFQRTEGTWSQQAYLKPSNAGFSFGTSVSASGDFVLVGAPLESSSSVGVNGNQSNLDASGSGAAYLFQRVGSKWVQQAYLKASNTGISDQFGGSAAIDGNKLLLIATFEDSNATGINGDGSNNNATDSGAAYIFEITPPEVFVHDGPDTGSARLADNQTQVVDFGITLPGQQVTRAFTIQNVRALPLTVTGITAPPGYAVVAAPAEPLAPQESATFFLHLTAEAPGTFSGPVTVSTNDSANPEFVFPVTGGVQSMTPGSLDLRFGTGGVVRADFNDSDDRAYAMTRLEDGRFVLAGRTTSGDLTDYAVLCLRPDGSVDPSFGDSGWATGTVAGFPAAGVSITGLAVKDGRILAAACPPGNDFISGAGRTFALMRLLPDGTPDATFGTGGVALDGSAAVAFTTGDVAFTASGKILVTGSLREGTNDRAYIRRFNQTGTVDTAFASSAGLLRLSGPSAGQCLVQNAVGEIFIGGRATTTGRLSVWRSSSGGVQLDVGTFPLIAPAGYPAEGAAPEFETVSALALQAAGKPVFAARRTAGLDRDTGHGFIAGQMAATLDPDVTFAATGAVLTDLVAGVNKEQANSVAVQADGRVVVAGRAGDEIAVLRYLPNGLPDSTFGTAGRVMIPVGPGASAYKVFVDAAGDLYVAGHAGGPGVNSQDFVLLKLIGSNDQQPAIAVQRSNAPGFPAVTSGQAQPVEYGVTRVTSPKTTIFFVRNTGTAPLTISNVSVPSGYRVTFLNANIPAGGTGEIQIQLMANAIGTFSGTVGIASNDPVLGTFTFPVTGQVLPNSAPVYTPLTIETVEGKPATLLLDKLLQQVTDPDGDPVNLISFPLLSAKGAAIARVEKSLVFTQPVPLAGTDTFEVRFSDGFRSITGQVTVVVATDPGLNPKNAPRVTKLPDGNVRMSFSGIARRSYSIQQTTDGVNFNVLGTATADRVGDVKFVTSTPPPINSMFRIRQL